MTSLTKEGTRKVWHAFVYVADRKGGGDSNERDNVCCVILNVLEYVLVHLIDIATIYHDTSIFYWCIYGSMMSLCTHDHDVLFGVQVPLFTIVHYWIGFHGSLSGWSYL